MADPNELNLHDLQMSDTTAFTVGGAAVRRTRVTFFIGSHGPFVREYEAEMATTQKIQDDIDSVIKQLRILTGAGG